MVADLASTATARPRVGRRVPTTSRRAALEAAKDPGNWRAPADVRPALRAAINETIPPSRFQMWAVWLVTCFDARGELHRVDRRAIIRISKISESTCTRYLRELDRLGLVEREQVARWNRRTRHFDRAVVIRAGQRFHVPDQRVCIPRASDQPNGHKRPFDTYTVRTSSVVDGSVGSLPRRPEPVPAEFEPSITGAERDAVDNDWWRLAFSKTDLPGQRPGYGPDENMTERRLARGETGVRTRAEVRAGMLATCSPFMAGLLRRSFAEEDRRGRS